MLPHNQIKAIKAKHSDSSGNVKFHNLGDNKHEHRHIDHINIEKLKNGKIAMKSQSTRNGKKLVKIVGHHH